MKSRRRRFWTFAISTGAVLVILAAAASGLFQLAVQAVPGYRAEVERYVRELSGRPVRIEALGLTWRYYYPSLELIGVALMSEDGRSVLLQAERLRLGFGLTRLARGEYAPNRLELAGLTLDVLRTREGRIEVRGIEAGETGGTEPLQALQPLTEFAQLRVERCRLNLRDERTGQIYSFGVAHAELDRGLLSDALDAELTLPAALGDSAHLEASFKGELLQPASWSGEWRAELLGLVAGPWLAPYLAHGARVEMTGAEARLRGRVEQGRTRSVRLALLLGPVQARRADHTAGFTSLDAQIELELLDDGWKAQLARFDLDGVQGPWPSTRGELRAFRQPGAETVYEARMEFLRLADLAPWVQMAAAPGALARLDRLSGELHDLEFRLQGEGEERRYALRARFEQLALPAIERTVGFSGLRGELAADETGGRAVLQETPARLELPGLLLADVVPLEAWEAEVEWRRQREGWRVGMPQFRWALWSTRGQGRFSLTLPDDHDRSPELDLEAQFTAEDVTRAKPLMPRRWGPGLRDWLDRAIVSGRSPRGQLVIQGPLADFPFDQRPTGRFTLDIEAQNVLLAYQPDWPAVENIDARLKFRGHGLNIEATRGSVAGNPVNSAVARLPDFATAQLLIDGTVTGESARFYDFLSRSPLRDDLSGLLNRTQVRGPAQVEVHLDIPLREARSSRASGRVALDGVELSVRGFEEPIKDIHGELGFGGPGIVAEKLTARVYEVPVQVALQPRAEGGSLLTAAFRVAIDPAGQGVSALIPAWLRKKLAGAGDWRAELPIGRAEEAPLTLKSDLSGVAVNLPPPLGKSPEEALPLTLTVGGSPLRITAEYAERFGADLRFAPARRGLSLERGTLRAGAGATPTPADRGLSLSGQLAELDVQAWVAQLQGSGIESQMQHTVRRADLQLGRAVWGPYALRDARYQWGALKDGWQLALSGAGGAGELRWSTPNRGLLTARLERLALEFMEKPDDVPDGEPADPNALPLYDLDVRQLTLNQARLGHVSLLTARTELGQKLSTLKAEGGLMKLGAEGEWRRRAGQSSASASFQFEASDIAALLSAFRYTPNLDAKSARVTGNLTWAPSERGLDWTQAQGQVHLEFENGQLRAVEPGAGRVLGLVNFYALPRRLTLNFRDVLSSGLGFDSIRGDFALREGSAHTDNLRILGPSLRMDVRGRIGLAARDYDQQVTVYPDVSAGVTLGAVLLGGPVAGVLTLIAQEILNKPLDQVTQLSYRVTGSWDNPQVERGAAPPATNGRTPGPPSQKP